jgi:hypothetical protein
MLEQDLHKKSLVTAAWMAGKVASAREWDKGSVAATAPGKRHTTAPIPQQVQTDG